MMSICVSLGFFNVGLGMGTRNNGDKTKSVLFFNRTLYERYMAQCQVLILSVDDIIALHK